MASKKQSKEEKLAKRRLAKRKKYAELKENKELYAIEREKERLRYLKRKEAKKIVGIANKSPRAQREQRKKWRENKRRSLKKKEELKKVQEVFVNNDNMCNAVTTTTEVKDPLSINDDKAKEVGKEKILSNDDTIRSQAEIIEKLRKRVQLIKNQRLKDFRKYKNICSSMKKENKRLKQIIQRLNASSNQNRNQIILQNKDKRQGRNKVIRSKIESEIIQKIHKFFLEDRNSRMAAGIKECITKNKIKKQKRYLVDTLKNLYELFQKENTNIKLSYSFFCKNRPFWVVFPKNNRNTCQCILHENNELLIKALHKTNLLNVSNNEELLQSLCCDKYNLECLDRRCEHCQNNDLQYSEFDKDIKIAYSEWIKTADYYQKGDETKQKLVWNKVEKIENPLVVIQKLNNSVQKFLPHCGNIIAQYSELKKLKTNLENNEAVVHVDFSENYFLKFNSEIQSFHFGGSRSQISIHTVVIYIRDYNTYEVKPFSFCTVSDNLKHDASAIWAHIVPILQYIEKLSPFIDTIHFVSDSPSSQYRNRFMFHILTQLHKDYIPLRCVTWNYLETGHGKGAPDGLGGVLKRTADRVVNQGEDIGSFEKFVEVVQKNIPNITIQTVNSDNILKKEKELPTKVPCFKGTMNTHQVVYRVNSDANQSAFRKRSCFDCLETNTPCKHGKHLGFLKHPPIDDTKEKNNLQNKENNQPITLSSRIIKTKKVLTGTPKSIKFTRILDQPSTSALREYEINEPLRVQTLATLTNNMWENSTFIENRSKADFMSNEDSMAFEEFVQSLNNNITE